MHYSKDKDFKPSKVSRQRRRTLAAAFEIIAPLNLQGEELVNAERRIHSAKQPRAAAKKILAHHLGKSPSGTHQGSFDLSDVQELRVKLIRKLGVLYASDAEAFILKRMEREILHGTMTNEQFETLQRALENMEHTDADLKMRKQEARFQRLGTID